MHLIAHIPLYFIIHPPSYDELERKWTITPPPRCKMKKNNNKIARKRKEVELQLG
jgi:hypothetical protein